MATGFTKWQFETLKALLSNRSLPALPAALPSEPHYILPTSAPPSELPLQQIPAPLFARSYPPTLSVEAIEEMEHPLRNIGPMRKRLGASKMVPTSRLPFDEICIGWPTKLGGSNMLFSHDENPDAWYTTMLNHT